MFSYLDKEYLITQEKKTFDEALEICKNRNEPMVQIKSNDEYDFIGNTIVKQPVTHVW